MGVRCNGVDVVSLRLCVVLVWCNGVDVVSLRCVMVSYVMT